MITRHYDQEGFFLTDGFFAVTGTLAHRDGLLVEATFCGSSSKAPADLQNIRSGSDHLLFLQRFHAQSSLVTLRPGLQAVHEWRPDFLDSASDVWITSGLRSRARDAFRECKITKVTTAKKAGDKTPSRTSSLLSKVPPKSSKGLKVTTFFVPDKDSFPPLPPPAEPPEDEDLENSSTMPGSKALHRLKATLAGEVSSGAKDGKAAGEESGGVSKEAIIESLKQRLAEVRNAKSAAAPSRRKSSPSRLETTKTEPLTLLQRLSLKSADAGKSTKDELSSISLAISGVTLGDGSADQPAETSRSKRGSSAGGSDDSVVRKT